MALTKKGAVASLVSLTAGLYLLADNVNQEHKLPIIGRPMEQFQYSNPALYSVAGAAASGGLLGGVMGIAYLGLVGKLREPREN